MDSNDVLFYSGQDPHPTVRFDLDSHSITDGQPWGGVSCSGRTITVRAGRHGSQSVARWFNGQFSGAAALRQAGAGAWGTLATNDFHPEDLNFAIRGTLSLGLASGTVVLPNFVLGQGHWGSENNWWITAPGMTLNWDSPTNPHRVMGTSMQGTQNARTVVVNFIYQNSPNQFPFKVS